MKHPVSRLVWLLALTSSLGVAAEEIRFQFIPPAVGERWVEMASYSMEIAMELRNAQRVIEKATLRQARSERKTETILASGKEGATRLEVEYHEAKTYLDSPPASEFTKQEPVMGERYIVDLATSPIGVSYTAPGITPTTEEIKYVRNDYREGGRFDRLALIFQDRSFITNETVSLRSDVIESLWPVTEGDITVKRFDLKLKSVESLSECRCAVFLAEVTMIVKDEDGKTLEMNLNGELHVDVSTARPMSMTLKGPVRLQGQINAMNTTLIALGNGTIEFQIVKQRPTQKPKSSPKEPDA